MKTARIENNVVVEILVPIVGFQIEQCFHADILAQCVSVAEDVMVGDTYTPPVIQTPAVETPVVEETTPTVTE
jgi:hypothetical protein